MAHNQGQKMLQHGLLPEGIIENDIISPNHRKIFAGAHNLRTANQRGEEAIELFKIHRVLSVKATKNLARIRHQLMAVVSRDDLGNSHAFKRFPTTRWRFCVHKWYHWIDGEIIKAYSSEARESLISTSQARPIVDVSWRQKTRQRERKGLPS